MKVLMKKTIAWPEGLAMVGQTTDVPDALGRLLIDAQAAVEQPPPNYADARPKIKTRGVK